jgi:enoyl-CoA hydratase
VHSQIHFISFAKNQTEIRIMSYNTLHIAIEGPTMIITINRPEVLNALNPQVIEELGQVMDEFIANDKVKGAILTGAGEKSFVAGADISQVNQIPADETHAFSLKGQAVFAKIEQATKPVIAAVNGFALGGGCELAMACHMRVAVEKARFGQPEVNLGLVAGYGGTQRLVRLIGRGKATELLLTGNMIKGPEALQLGLVNHVVPREELLTKCHDILNTIYEKSPLAVALTLKAIDAGVYDTANGFAVEAEAFGEAAASHDGREGTAAFLEKRKANFKGN